MSDYIFSQGGPCRLQSLFDNYLVAPCVRIVAIANSQNRESLRFTNEFRKMK